MPVFRLRSLWSVMLIWAIAPLPERLATATTVPEPEFAALRALREANVPDKLKSDEAAKIDWLNRRSVEVFDRGTAFLAEHATHPLRWDVLVLLRYGRDFRPKIFRSGFRQLLPVPESLAAWKKKYFPQLRSLLAATDASPAARVEALRQLIEDAADRGIRSPTESAQAIADVQGWFEIHEREFPRSGYTAIYHTYANLLDAVAPDRCVAFLKELEDRYQGTEYLDRSVREIVAGHRRALEAQALPMNELWARLQELDPVIGDPARFRGKVALLALGPVTYETFIERIEDLYAQFQPAGLEILQIAPFNHNFGLPPEPEQRRNMEKIVGLRGWRWPVLWNPRGHLQDIAGKWGFNTIPAWMLIGRDGRMVVDRNTPLHVAIPRELARPMSPGP